jgi:peptidylprolyl isomerase domain and WD repeat-containing protein 1
MPDNERYYRSFMHRDNLVSATVAPRTDFIITTSIDGYVKFWKKKPIGIEFVKQFKAHTDAVIAINVSFDGQYFASAGLDKSVKVFNVVTFGTPRIVKNRI